MADDTQQKDCGKCLDTDDVRCQRCQWPEVAATMTKNSNCRTTFKLGVWHCVIIYCNLCSRQKRKSQINNLGNHITKLAMKDTRTIPLFRLIISSIKAEIGHS